MRPAIRLQMAARPHRQAAITRVRSSRGRGSLKCPVRTERSPVRLNAFRVSERRLSIHREDAVLRTKTTATEPLTDELELTLETPKDLTVSAQAAEGVKGGVLNESRACACGTM